MTVEERNTVVMHWYPKAVEMSRGDSDCLQEIMLDLIEKLDTRGIESPLYLYYGLLIKRRNYRGGKGISIDNGDKSRREDVRIFPYDTVNEFDDVVDAYKRPDDEALDRICYEKWVADLTDKEKEHVYLRVFEGRRERWFETNGLARRQQCKLRLSIRAKIEDHFGE